LIKLNEEQNKAKQKIIRWYRKETYRKQIFTLSGIAGSGKSTILKYILAELGIESRTQIMTFTGKASQVLNNKGTPCRTIHSTVYKPIEKKDKDGEIIIEFQRKSKYEFYDTLLFVIDECSMLTNEVLDDLKMMGKPILLIGDHNQLPSIGEGHKYLDEPDVRLLKPERHALDNPIIFLANQIVEGNLRMTNQNLSDYVKVTNKYTTKDMLDADQVLVAKNKTRIRLNDKLRFKLGIESDYPVKGDKLVCKKNNWKVYLEDNDQYIFLVNGLSGINMANVCEANDYELLFKPDFGSDYFCLDNVDYDFLREEDVKIRRDLEYFQYGYAITCHSSQGSEYDSVFIKYENLYKTDMTKWLYTAVTRAVNKLIIGY
jgi:exodeoxyribonuclease-5